jgi:hypothetical protein
MVVRLSRVPSSLQLRTYSLITGIPVNSMLADELALEPPTSRVPLVLRRPFGIPPFMERLQCAAAHTGPSFVYSSAQIRKKGLHLSSCIPFSLGRKSMQRQNVVCKHRWNDNCSGHDNHAGEQFQECRGAVAKLCARCLQTDSHGMKGRPVARPLQAPKEPHEFI